MIKRHYKRIITLYEVPGAIEVREMAKTVMTGVTITCDVCGCNIDKDYYRIFTCDCGDCQWEDDELDDNYGAGNKAYYDICSPECLKCKLDDYLERSNNSNECNSEEFNVEHINYSPR